MLNSGNNPKVVKTAIDSVFYGEYDYPSLPGIATAENSLLFKQSSTQKAAEITLEYEGPGAWEEHLEEEERDEATIRTGNEKTHSVVNFKKTLKIPKEFYDDEMHDVVDRSVVKCGIRGRTTRDKKALNNYAGGFDDVKTSDSAYLFSNSHTAMDGSTIDNLETAALTPAALETMFKVLIEQKAQDGELGGHNPVALLVPPILFPDAQEFTKSELKPNVTDNNLNYVSLIYPGLQVLESPFVGAAYHSYTNADTSYYMVSRNHSVMRWVREAIYTNLIHWQYDDKDRWTYKMGYREVTSPISWEGLVGSNGTA